MKVLHVITTLFTGGVEKLMVDMLPHLNRMGIEADLMVFDGTHTCFLKNLKEAGVKIIAGPAGRSVYHPANILALRQIMSKYDIIHTHNSSPQIFASIASLGNRACLVTTEHNIYNRRREKSLIRPLDTWVYKQYDKITCVSKEVEHKLREHIGPSRAKDIVTIYNGIDVDAFRNATPSRELMEYRERNGNPHLLIMIAAFRPQKDQETLIKAMSYLPDKYHLILVGTGELIHRSETWVHDLGLDNRVVFLGQREDTAELLKASSAAILSTHYEGFGLAAIESMAAGIPTILTDVDALREVAEDAARFVRIGDSISLAHEIRKVVENKKIREDLIQKGHKRAEKFRLDTMVTGYSDLYRSILKERGKADGQ